MCNKLYNFFVLLQTFMNILKQTLVIKFWYESYMFNNVRSYLLVSSIPNLIKKVLFYFIIYYYSNNNVTCSKLNNLKFST